MTDFDSPQEVISPRHIVWKEPSKDSSGSMPLGNGDIGVNLWVEPGGDLLLYLSKTDAWSENGRLLKLGRLRISLNPNPFCSEAHFVQRLNPHDGEVTVRAKTGSREVSIRAWVDADRPIVQVRGDCTSRLEVGVSLEVWRTSKRQLAGRELFSAYGLVDSPFPTHVYPDEVCRGEKGRLIWYHRNKASIWPSTMKLQGLQGWKSYSKDPLLNRIFGGVVEGRGFACETDRRLVTDKPRSAFHIKACLLCARTRSVSYFLKRLRRELGKKRGTLGTHKRWWHSFWARSWIEVETQGDLVTGDVVTRGYTLQRYMNACAGRGEFPIKFNGSIFTVDAIDSGEAFDADYRRWGGPYWFQNTRLPYWSMLASGDFYLMSPFFKMYRDVLPMAVYRTKTYFGHEGAFFPETMYFWGSYANDNYGWDRTGKHVSHVDNRFIRWHYNSGLELLAMMLEYHSYTGSREFLRRTLLPIAEEVISFFDQHYPRNRNGKLLLDPSQALETYQRTINPLPDIAGLMYALDGLLGLDSIEPELRENWTRMRTEVPPLPVSNDASGDRLSPAETIIEGPNNCENPELYAVFPFRIFGIGASRMEMARKTFEARRFPGHSGWQQDDIQAATLGLAGDASRMVADRFGQQNPGSRFPAFWGPNFDWVPDQDHGCVGMKALQTMLLQGVGEQIILFPAWPESWNVDFKLKAPFRTTVRGILRGGRLTRLDVRPRSRSKDLVTMDPQDID